MNWILAEINQLFQQLIDQAKDRAAKARDFADNEIKIEPYLDLRYAGQGYELTVPCMMPPLKKEDLENDAPALRHTARTKLRA